MSEETEKLDVSHLYSPEVRARVEARERAEHKERLACKAVADVARTFFDAPRDFDATAQDIEEIRQVLARAKSRHKSRQTSAQLAAQGGPKHRAFQALNYF